MIGYLPEVNSRMCKATALAIAMVAVCYVTFGCLGSATTASMSSKYFPGILVEGLLRSNPQWLFDVILVCILLHVCGDYQVRRLYSTGCMHVHACVPSKCRICTMHAKHSLHKSAGMYGLSAMNGALALHRRLLLLKDMLVIPMTS